MSVSQGIASSPTIKRMAAGRMIRTIGYWFFTILIAWEMALGAYWDLFQISYVREVFTHLHLPSYFLIIMGIWKLPCAVVLLLPGVRRMKEWAYAGFVFDFVGAAWCHFAVQGFGQGVRLVIPIAVVSISYFTYHRLNDQPGLPTPVAEEHSAL